MGKNRIDLSIIYDFKEMFYISVNIHFLNINQTLNLTFNTFRIGLTLHRNKMQRCAGSCGGEEGACEAER